MHPSLQWFTQQSFQPRIELRRRAPTLLEDGTEIEGPLVPAWIGYEVIETDTLHLPHPDRYHPDMRILASAQRGELAQRGKALTACGKEYELNQAMVYEGDKRERCAECDGETRAALLEHEAILEERRAAAEIALAKEEPDP